METCDQEHRIQPTTTTRYRERIVLTWTVSKLEKMDPLAVSWMLLWRLLDFFSPRRCCSAKWTTMMARSTLQRGALRGILGAAGVIGFKRMLCVVYYPGTVWVMKLYPSLQHPEWKLTPYVYYYTVGMNVSLQHMWFVIRNVTPNNHWFI